MALHPDERPSSVAILRDSIFDSYEIPTRLKRPDTTRSEILRNVISGNVERNLVWISMIMLLISLIATVIH